MADKIIKLSQIVTSITVISAFTIAIVKWYFKMNKQEEEIKRIKEENTLIVFGLSACLDGLMQMGANHSVPVAKEKLDKYINKMAHQ